MKLVLAFMFLSFMLIAAPMSSHALCVKGTVVNVRNGPGTEYKSVWQVFRYMPMKKVGVSVSGDWYAVRDVDGDVSWVHKTLVTGEYHCAIVKSEIANVRTGPGTHYPEKYSEPMQKYDSFRILKTKGAWVKVKDDMNNIGWVHKRYLWIN
jgi:SH3-like domain-containing protein